MRKLSKFLKATTDGDMHHLRLMACIQSNKEGYLLANWLYKHFHQQGINNAPGFSEKGMGTTRTCLFHLVTGIL